ncbi:uncharacterized protein LOC128675844 [Plodia interpunctella]|uniref:uncharacterized protein LOC128675844 n=1 Tax=Plodia interpunctella TaxID=58824 RepID=UPI002368CF29|nr:uncharacterized protein LOC128675844 [Plodia interpunctella]
MQLYRYLIAFVICVIDISAEYTQKCTNTTLENIHDSSKLLSRRKRYLTFPDGSSFQVVFCAQNQGYLQIGNVVWFGNTAALAWELPSDPKFFAIFKEHKKLFENGHRRSDVSRYVYYLDDNGNVIAKKPYKRKPFVNPAFAKRSVDMNTSFTKKKLHQLRRKTEILKNIPPDSVQFHREGRKTLYEKIETFLNSMGWNGDECILRFLCEAGKENTQQGAFLEEIFRATFSLPVGPQFDQEKHKRYDVAHGSRGDCAAMYSRCEDVNRFPLYEQ